MEKIRVGVIGQGNMGAAHAGYLSRGEVEGAVLTAVCDESPERLRRAIGKYGEDVKAFDDASAFLSSGSIDGVLICTPHYSHPKLAIEAFRNGLHVLIEKPAGVYTRQVREMNEAASSSDRVFGIMYNQRTNPMYRKLRDMIRAGELGEIRRLNWIITDWYRPQCYYDSGGWRATWAGEGGGVLLNQCPHQLDLWQWISGMMPQRIRAFCAFGQHRDIEVENEVTAFAEYANGATAVFITSTCETPGTNRFEVTGDRGKAVVEGGRLHVWKLDVSEGEFNRTTRESFAHPPSRKVEIELEPGEGEQHAGITRDWVRAIRHGTPLLAPGEEGIHGLTLSNAMLLSAWTDGWAELPLDEERFYHLLQQRIETSRGVRS
ncbi:gfo/Idh/MocA family oxidoreductase [Cohnella sp. CFH 77786]|uniref:Gfo/Idh/MocA family protein n=1 Tax=Cohnella sp. CFH 77786 TaxID=2662265 RepID=UPI001C60F9A5|nr:Gfo/Idh/MocA family oxidoreductase [Cohnella sp. CFH 77786]MBW5445569.1 gfo/Idh/MocA family oxidoreductase [Cohnella sp. CFH 77786]